jgi:hypothetical protein
MTQLRGNDRSQSYFALIADVVGSREVGNRARLQRSLLRLVDDLNQRHGAGLVAPLALVAGDELQGLAEEPGLLVDLSTHLAEELHPVRLAVGIGRGELSTDLAEEVGAMDGPAFHRAREALVEARQRDAWVHVSGWGAEADALLSATFSLIAAVRGGWTSTQLRYARAARTALQREVAERFGVGASTVSESLRASRASVVHQAEEALRGFLRQASVEGAP